MEKQKCMGYTYEDMSIRKPQLNLQKITGLEEINFSALCRAIRDELELTQVEMAEKVGLSNTGYGDLERGRSEPSARTLIILLALRAERRNINLKGLLL